MMRGNLMRGMWAAAALLALALSGCGSAASGALGASTSTVYRLAPGTTTWQNLGETAGPVIAVPATGPIWSSTATADQFLGYYTAQLPA